MAVIRLSPLSFSSFHLHVKPGSAGARWQGRAGTPRTHFCSFCTASGYYKVLDWEPLGCQAWCDTWRGYYYISWGDLFCGLRPEAGRGPREGGMFLVTKSFPFMSWSWEALWAFTECSFSSPSCSAGRCRGLQTENNGLVFFMRLFFSGLFRAFKEQVGIANAPIL